MERMKKLYKHFRSKHNYCIYFRTQIVLYTYILIIFLFLIFHLPQRSDFVFCLKCVKCKDILSFFFCTSRDVEGQTSTHKQHREYEKMKQQQKNMREICITKQELCNLADALLLLISYRRVCMDEYFLSKFFLFYFFISTAAAAFLFFFVQCNPRVQA